MRLLFGVEKDQVHTLAVLFGAWREAFSQSRLGITHGPPLRYKVIPYLLPAFMRPRDRQ